MLKKEYFHLLNENELKQNIGWDFLVSQQAIDYISNHIIHCTKAKDDYGHDFSNNKIVKRNHDVFNNIGGIKTYLYDHNNKAINPIYIKQTLKQIAAGKEAIDQTMIDAFENFDEKAYVPTTNILDFRYASDEELNFLKNDQISFVKINGNSELIKDHIDVYDDDYAYVVKKDDKTYFYNHISNNRVEKLDVLDYELFIPNHIEKPYEIQGILDSIFFYHTNDIKDERLKECVYYLINFYFSNGNNSLIYLAARSKFSLEELINAKEYILNEIAIIYNDDSEKNLKLPTKQKALEHKYFYK